MIIVEQSFSGVTPLEDTNANGGKKLFLKGIFMESEQRNRNGRIYSRDEIAEAVELVNQHAASGRFVLGELDHPPNRLEVWAQCVSHKIVEMQMQGNNAIGRAEILTDLPMGKIAEGLIRSGITLGVSTRGSGQVDGNGRVNGFKLKTVDIVVEPSAINAYPESLMESIEMARRGHILKDVAIASIHEPQAQKHLEHEINRFIAEIFKRK